MSVTLTRKGLPAQCGTKAKTHRAKPEREPLVPLVPKLRLGSSSFPASSLGKLGACRTGFPTWRLGTSLARDQGVDFGFACCPVLNW